MANRSSINLPSLFAAFIVLSAAFLAAVPSIAAQSKTNERKPEPTPTPAQARTPRQENKKPPDTTSYFYEFTQPDFMVRHITIQHDAMGRGKIKFQKQGVDAEIEEPIELSTGALGRIRVHVVPLAVLQGDPVHGARGRAFFGDRRQRGGRHVRRPRPV